MIFLSSRDAGAVVDLLSVGCRTHAKATLKFAVENAFGSEARRERQRLDGLVRSQEQLRRKFHSVTVDVSRNVHTVARIDQLRHLTLTRSEQRRELAK